MTDGLEKMTLRGLTTADYIKAESRLSVEQRSAFAAGLATALNAQDAAPEDYENAEAILRLIIWNGEPSVVQAMAEAAADNPNTPHALAWALANDDEAVAAPILEAALALSDADLVAIVEATESFSKMGAIARRSTVSQDVARSLAQCGDETTVQTLLGNSKADIPDDAFASVLDRHGQHKQIQEAMIARETISASVAERLSKLVGPALAGELARRHQVTKAAPSGPGLADEFSEEDWKEIISEMAAEGSITASFLVRKLCAGSFEFFCRALAAAAKTPRDSVVTEVLEGGSALPALWERGSLAHEWLPVAWAALDALLQIDKKYSKSDPGTYRRNIVDRTQTILRSEKHKFTEAQTSFFRSL